MFSVRMGFFFSRVQSRASRKKGALLGEVLGDLVLGGAMYAGVVAVGFTGIFVSRPTQSARRRRL
jgi:hypothetical protein